MKQMYQYMYCKKQDWKVCKFIMNLYLNLSPSLCIQFHKDCIDSWLLHSHPTCPVDGQVVWDPVTAQLEAEEEAERTSQR